MGDLIDEYERGYSEVHATNSIPQANDCCYIPTSSKHGLYWLSQYLLQTGAPANLRLT